MTRHYGTIVICVLLGGLISTVGGCGLMNDCSYWERCDGGSRLICGGGHDHQVGRTVRELPCPDVASYCVEYAPAHDETRLTTFCTVQEDYECDEDTEPRCEGSVIIACHEGRIKATDCEWGHVWTDRDNARQYCVGSSCEIEG